ncbi:hypothetical protein EsDP_00002434 [Epichloe bromicola]|uniref:Uncharacterized protein n=1 Tax=Epichloe bromicola TaxID=79588 RepID=A0ABQ0CKT2_9HYPO
MRPFDLSPSWHTHNNTRTTRPSPSPSPKTACSVSSHTSSRSSRASVAPSSAGTAAQAAPPVRGRVGGAGGAVARPPQHHPLQPLPACYISAAPPAGNGSRSRNSRTISTSAVSTPGTTSVSRTPMHSQHYKQQHVTPVAIKTRPLSASVSKMPVGDRPRQPQLSASAASAAAAAARSINRAPPLTPKIAAKGTPVTPLTRRPHSSTPVLASTAIPRDDTSTPGSVCPANITPRSGPRQIRVDSATSTPSGTPNLEKTSEQSDLTADSNDSSKFFYASDAKSAQPAPLPRPASVPQKASNTFFYANGTTIDGGRNISPPSNSTSMTTADPNLDPVSSKFFFANGAPDMSTRPNFVASSSASVLSSTSRLASSRPITSNPNLGPTASLQRPASPIKTTSTPMAQTLRSNAASPTSPKRPCLIPSPPTSQQQSSSSYTVPKRKVSIDAAPREMGGCRRTGSAATIEPLTLPRFTLSPNSSEMALHSPPLSPGLSQPAMTMASLMQAADDPRDNDGWRDEDTQSEAYSPTKCTQLRDSVSELVANARRERKVQDLEITNASLEAINRTLERQLRKQTADLRRYRRLSRSGALSAASSRVTSLALTEPPTDMSNVEEADETELREDQDVDSLYESDLSSIDSMSTEDDLLPGAKIEARRRRDEKRLQLDLTKHQEMLIDSQKMNQSLKRCLDFTEALIKEGHKALEYRVRVSDIKLGGRVLAPPDEDDEGAVSFIKEDTTTRTDDPGLEPPWPRSSQDRDSGIELPSEGS